MFEKIIIFLAMYHATASGIELPTIPGPTRVIEGVASWYGGGKGDNGLHGSITATGEPFRPEKKSCATRNTPLRRAVLVVSKRTRNRIWCYVNDRGPYGALNEEGEWLLKLRHGDEGEWRGVIDMSREAATQFGFDFRRGFEDVQVYY